MRSFEFSSRKRMRDVRNQHLYSVFRVSCYLTLFHAIFLMDLFSKALDFIDVNRDLRSLYNKRLTSKLLAPSSMLTQYEVGSKFNTGIHSWLVVRIVRVSARGGLEKWSRGRKRFLASDWTLSIF